MFDQENRVLRILNKITDLVIVSCMWLVACLPIITIGAACASGYDAALKLVRQDSGQVFETYVRGVKENLRATWLPTLLLAIVEAGFALVAVRLWPIRDQFLGGVYFFMTCFLFLTAAIYAVHLFSLLGRFTLDRAALAKVALWLTFTRPTRNLLLAFVMLGLIWMTLTVWQLIFILPGAFFWFLTYLEEPSFHRYLNYEDDLEKRTDEE